MIVLKKNQLQKVEFVMVDTSGNPVSGIAPGDLTITLSIAGAAFVPSTGTKAEVGSGWYTYDLTAAETATEGPLGITITAPGCANQNLLFFVQSPTVTAQHFEYTLRETTSLIPISGAEVWVTSDAAGTVKIDHGFTDGTGKVTFFLNPGNYYFWRTCAGYSFANPEAQVIPA